MTVGLVLINMSAKQTVILLIRVIRTPVDNLLGYIYDRGMYIGSMYINGF